MRSITLKLIIAFLIVSLVGIIYLGVLAFRATQAEAKIFFDRQDRESVAARLGEYYRDNGSWDGVDELVTGSAFLAEFGRGIVIISAQGQVIFPDEERFPVRQFAPAEIEKGNPILVDGEVVGTLLPGAGWPSNRPPQQDFLRRIYRNLLYGVLGGAVVSLLLGLLVARGLTHTLRELTTATQAVARGDLDQQVPVRSRDELGELAVSFNQMSADLSRARDQRRQMTADIAHELRTPISVILGHAEALSEGVLSPDAGTFHIIHDETKRLKRLVDDLRILSLSDAGELPLERAPLSPWALLERTAAAHTPRARGEAIRLQIDADPDLPLVDVDANRLAQVLDNLLDNALRYTPPGGEINLTARPSPEGVELRVADSGPGIPADELPHVFDRFYRGDKSRQRGAGESGLGLAIARSIVVSHGGRIWAESPPGEGAVFVIVLPSLNS